MKLAELPLASTVQARALARILAPERAAEQPPLLPSAPVQMTAVVGSLALGGAERIVLDWAGACAKRHRVRVIVLRDVPAEWPVPESVELVRLRGRGTATQLRALGRDAAAAGNPVILCHLLLAHERAALTDGGALCVPVLHNAAAGWLELAEAMAGGGYAIAVSRAAARDVRLARPDLPCAVVHHVPRTPASPDEARSRWRTRWAVPADAVVIGMIGGIKPQKAYPRALRVLAALLETRDAYLVIVGGPTGRDGALAWDATLAQARRLDVAHRVRLTGAVPHAARCLAAFDAVLNTSRYEGLSVATLEALAAGLPVIATATGGQGELEAPGLTLVPFDACDRVWAGAITAALACAPLPPAWRGFPSARVWTLFHLAHPVDAKTGVLFVTANLNAGGAQRSLVNLALALQGRFAFEIVVSGDSSSSVFVRALAGAGVPVHRSSASHDCFDHAEAIIRRVVASRCATVCFWNADPKLKLLLTKVLGVIGVAVVDVSPGAYSFEEMRAALAFQRCIAFSEGDYDALLARLVLKYRAPGYRSRATVIPNGVVVPRATAAQRTALARRVVVSGRIAPTKFLLEIVDAMARLWRRHPHVELHVLGCAETRHAAYAREVVAAIGDELGVRVFLHGAAFDAPARLGEFDVALVLGEHQGCPNAVLEALAAGVAVIANDSGGTRELVKHGRTGLLLAGREPETVAAALAQLVGDPALAQRLARAGRRHVERRFSMTRMAHAYRKLFTTLQNESR